MTWTLRVYNGDGEEIGWLTVNPYDWEITHPDGAAVTGPSVNVFVEGSFSEADDPHELGFTDFLGDQTRTADFLEFNSSKDHLEYVQEEIETSSYDVTTTLQDE